MMYLNACQPRVVVCCALIGVSVALVGCAGGGTTASGPDDAWTHRWTPPSGLVNRLDDSASGPRPGDPGFDAWLATRNNDQMNARPALPANTHSWVEVSHWDVQGTSNGRPRNWSRTRTRTYESGRRR